MLSCSKKPLYNEFKVYAHKSKIQVSAGGESFIAVKVEIPGKKYIYGNPKGPGTGKPTTMTAKSKFFIFKKTQYLKSEKYKPQPDEDFVWRYTTDTSLFIPFKVKNNTKKGEYIVTVKFESLMCDNAACVPKDFNLKIKVIVADTGRVDYGQLIISKFQSSKPADELLKPKKKNSNTSLKKTDSNDLDQIKSENFIVEYIETSEVSGLIQAIIFGLLAGMILNIMPCVLPVVSLKIMSFVQHAGEDRKVLIKLGSLFSLGILVTFGVLAGLAAFLGYSWGGLFQHKIFLIVMTAIIFALALSMFHVFTIGTPGIAGKAAAKEYNIYTDAFLKGLLATLLATPCSGPFLGGTLAWALTQSPVIIFITFMSVGVGMALPYFILTLNPKFLKLIPKPGNWMNTFEIIMGFFLIFTVVYMVNIFDNNSIMPMVTFLAFLAVGLWQYGKYGSIVQTYSKRIISLLILVIITVSGYFISFNYLYEETKDISLKGQKFSVERLYENKNNNRITIIKFTADWCPNCKLVEKLSLYTKDVAKLINENKIDFLIADITEKNPVTEKLLEKLGSKSIPFLAVIPPGKNFTKPYCLRDVYSEMDVIKAINKALDVIKK